MKAARIRRQLTAAYHCSYIRLALNFYTAYEAAAEKKALKMIGFPVCMTDSVNSLTPV